MRAGKRARALCGVLALFISTASSALNRTAVEKLVFGESDERIQAIGALVAEGDPRAAEVLAALADGELQTAGKRVLIVRAGEALDAATGEKVAPLPAEREDVVANNRLRGAIGRALAALKLVSRERGERLAAARALAGGADASMLPLVKRVLEAETDADVRSLLELIAASMELKAGDKRSRLSACGIPKPRKWLGTEPRPMPNSTRPLLSTSSVATSSAMRRGCESGNSTIAIPSRSVLVRSATAASSSIGAGMIERSGMKCCSTGHTDSNPSASAWAACSRVSR